VFAAPRSIVTSTVNARRRPSIRPRILQRSILRETAVKECQRCKKSAWNLVAGEKLQVCAHCQQVRYCSKHCQRCDWSEHKSRCTDNSTTTGRRPRRPMRHTVVANLAQECLRQECVRARRAHVLGNYVCEALAWYHLCNAYRDLGHLHAAMKAALHALTLLTASLKPSALLGQLYEAVGETLLLLGRLSEALVFFDHGLRLALDRNDTVARNRLYTRKGRTLELQGHIETAHMWYTLCFDALVAEYADAYSLGRVYGYFASIHCEHKHYAKAFFCITQYMTSATLQESRSDIGLAHGLFTQWAFLTHDYPLAMMHQQQQIKIAIELGHRLEESRAYGRLGAMYLTLKDYPDAIANFERQLVTAYAVDDVWGELQACQALLPLVDDNRNIVVREDKLRTLWVTAPRADLDRLLALV
jgi:tetratricopeptide (TPR) repeat protein